MDLWDGVCFPSGIEYKAGKANCLMLCRPCSLGGSCDVRHRHLKLPIGLGLIAVITGLVGTIFYIPDGFQNWMFPMLCILAGIVYIRQARKLILTFQFLFLYFAIVRLASIIYFKNAVNVSAKEFSWVILVTVIPLVVIAVFTFIVEREKLKTWIRSLF